MMTRTTHQTKGILPAHRRKGTDLRWLVTYRAVWLRGERQNCPTGKGHVLIRCSPETNWTSIIDVDPADWAAGLAKELRKFRQAPKNGQMAVELIQIFSLVPLHREALKVKRDFAAILTSTSATPERCPVH